MEKFNPNEEDLELEDSAHNEPYDDTYNPNDKIGEKQDKEETKIVGILKDRRKSKKRSTSISTRKSGSKSMNERMETKSIYFAYLLSFA